MRHLCALVAAGCVFGSIGLLGCSGALNPSRATDRDDLSELKRRVLELQEQAAVTQVELDRVRRDLALLREPSSAEGQSEEPGGNKGSSALESLNSNGEVMTAAPVVAPKNTLESFDLAPHVMRPPTSEEASDLVEASDSAEDLQTGGLSGEAAATLRDPAVDDNRAVSDQAQQLYDQGYTLYHQSRYIDAESGFRRFLQIYPQNELSDNAQYWIGECRYARGDIRGALAAFQETVERYPAGNKVPSAILKLAGCLEELGASEAAQARYDEVIRRFPNTAAATIAEERRQEGE